jgi:polysaccharide export outer membrane protein
VSVLGAVNSPGIKQLQGQKTLFEVLSLAGGLRRDAGNNVTITRNLEWGRIPLPGAKTDPSGKYSVASISAKSITTASNPGQNIVIMPGDTVAVTSAEVVYAVGSVNKPGGFLLGERESISALQVVSLAEGLTRIAAGDRAKILRAVPGSPNRAEIAVNLKELMAGTGSDVKLQADDILFIPNSKTKGASMRALDAVVQVATGVAIYGKY